MDFIDFVDDALFRYPSLWFKDEFYEYRVMEHMFFVIGNGFDWENGELTSNYEERKKQTWRGFLREVMEEYDHQEGNPVYLRSIFEDFGLKVSEESLQLFKKEQQAAKLRRKKGINRFYPFSERHSMAFEVPEDVKQDWLEGAIHFLEFSLTRPLTAFYHNHSEWTEEQEIEHAQKQVALVEKTLEKLKKQYEEMYG